MEILFSASRLTRNYKPFAYAELESANLPVSIFHHSRIASSTFLACVLLDLTQTFARDSADATLNLQFFCRMMHCIANCSSCETFKEIKYQRLFKSSRSLLQIH